MASGSSLRPHDGHVVHHLELFVFFDDIVRQVVGDGEDGAVVLGGETFPETQAHRFRADFLELLAAGLFGGDRRGDQQGCLVRVARLRAGNAGLVESSQNS